MKGYADLYLLPVPMKNIKAYRLQATEFGKVVVKYGALSYREFIGEDLHPEGSLSFADVVNLKRSEILTIAVAEFNSRKHRDQVMKKVIDDPRIQKMMKEKPLANMKMMHYGGFETLVDA